LVILQSFQDHILLWHRKKNREYATLKQVQRDEKAATTFVILRHPELVSGSHHAYSRILTK